MKFFNQLKFGSDGFSEKFVRSTKEFAVTLVTDVPEELDHEQVYVDLANSLGRVVLEDEDPESAIQSKGVWTEIHFNEAKRTDAYKYSDKHHPLHTDYSHVPIDLNMTFFFCVKNAEFGGATYFLDSDLLVSYLKRYDKALFDRLCSTEILFQRAGSARQVERKMKVLDFDDKGVLLNWNYHRAKNLSNSGNELEMVEAFQAFLHEKILLGGLLTSVKLKPGDGVFINDRRALHGRYSFFGDRHLKKGAIMFNKS